MSNHLFDAVARIARHEAEARATIAIGVIRDVHRDAAGSPDHAVTLELRDRQQVFPRVPIAVGALGVVAAPSVGELVVVAFVEGDIQHPIVIGRLHNTDVPPPKHGDGQIVLELPTGSGTVKLVLDPATPDLSVKFGSDTEIKVTDKLAEIKIGDAKLTLDANGSAELKADVGGNKLTIGAGGDISIEASGKLKLKASQIEIEGSGGVKINGATVELN